jgi:hypothetical protein
MIDTDELTKQFLTEYHKYPLSEMVNGIDEFLKSDVFVPFQWSPHLVYLASQMRRLKTQNKEYPALFPKELPGMVYGMLFNAWDKLIEDIKHAAEDNHNANR